MDTITNIAVKDLTMRGEKIELSQHEVVDWETKTPQDLTTNKRKAASILDENQPQIDDALLERLARAIQGGDTAENNSSSIEQRDGLSTQENAVIPPPTHSSIGGRGSALPLPPGPQEPKKRQRYQRRNSFVIRRRQGGMLLPPGFLSEIQNLDQEAEDTNADRTSPAHCLAHERPRSLPDIYVGGEETSDEDTMNGWGHSSWPSMEAKLLHSRLSNLSFTSPHGAGDENTSNWKAHPMPSAQRDHQTSIESTNDKQTKLH